MKIEVGEFVRTKNGKIRKITEEYQFNEYGRFWFSIKENKKTENCNEYSMYIINGKDIVKHSKNIIDLIEIGDILKLKDGEKWEVQEHQGDGNWIQTEWEVIENEEDLKSKVDSILTKEQFSSLEYKI